jgi:hypothetical protein
MQPRPEKAINHLDILQKFVYRLEGDLPPDTRARLHTIIGIYERLYVKG